MIIAMFSEAAGCKQMINIYWTNTFDLVYIFSFVHNPHTHKQIEKYRNNEIIK